MSACRETPTPTLPRKREKTVLVSFTSICRKAHASSLSRLRGRVARSSERDGWGLAQRIQLPEARFAVRPE
jgi:hypothetical protein